MSNRSIRPFKCVSAVTKLPRQHYEQLSILMKNCDSDGGVHTSTTHRVAMCLKQSVRLDDV